MTPLLRLLFGVLGGLAIEVALAQSDEAPPLGAMLIADRGGWRLDCLVRPVTVEPQCTISMQREGLPYGAAGAVIRIEIGGPVDAQEIRIRFPLTTTNAGLRVGNRGGAWAQSCYAQTCLFDIRTTAQLLTALSERDSAIYVLASPVEKWVRIDGGGLPVLLACQRRFAARALQWERDFEPLPAEFCGAV